MTTLSMLNFYGGHDLERPVMRATFITAGMHIRGVTILELIRWVLVSAHRLVSPRGL